MTFFDFAALVRADLDSKPGNTDYDQDAISLAEFYEDRAQAQIFAFLQRLGMGDKQNILPLDVSALKRIIEEQSVVYATPPIRRLLGPQGELDDDDPVAEAVSDILEAMLYDLHWQAADELRNLYRNVAVMFVETASGVETRLFEPFNLKRKCSDRCADKLDQDEAISFQLKHHREPANQRFELWLHNDDGTWIAHQIDGAGELAGVQPFGDHGLSPFGGTLPAFILYDEHPRGRAWLPASQSRLAYAKNAAAICNDIVYLIKQEAHTTITVATDDQRGVPTEVGPGKVWTLPGEADVKTLTTSPKISESSAHLDRVLRQWAGSESLPADMFAANTQPSTGAALKIKERSIARRRKRQVPMVAPVEADAYRRLAVVHNTYAEARDVPPLPLHTMRASASDTWQPVDQKELQETAFKDIAVGAQSIIDYRMRAFGETRAQAIRNHRRVQDDRARYPVARQQNPAALADGGPHAATGPGGARKTPGAFNPELETASEGASVTAAARTALN
tara:strand:+ start:2585 stop:4108 length:1524 start_codon:yes stop_codon:yes gene_type:complete